MIRAGTLLLPWLVLAAAPAADAVDTAKPSYQAEWIFPLHPQHNHAPSIVACPNGDLLVSWYRGSGERTADDVAVYGARSRHASVTDRHGPSQADRSAGTAGDVPRTRTWSQPFLMADHPGFPDCNTAMMVDRHQRLWLFWPIILAHSWQSCLTCYAVSNDYLGPGTPHWNRHDVLFLKPDNFQNDALRLLDGELAANRIPLTTRMKKALADARRKLADPLYQRLGWQPRCKPTILPGGRILLPLYSDTFSISLMAISDNDGATWYASKPLLGFGNIQPTVLRRNNGTLVAYMRENGPRDRIRIAESQDNGISWGPVGVTDLPNPGSGLDGVRLANGHWLLVYNDSTRDRRTLAVSISSDEGKTWTSTRHLEKQPRGAYHYPAVIQASDGTIHIVYSYFVEGGKTMKHVAINEAWIRRGD